MMPSASRSNFTVFLWLLLATQAFANPVSFKDGVGIMPVYSKDSSELQVNYSFTNRFSFGPSIYYKDGESSRATFVIAQLNYLLKRWNELESQANIYASLGVGGRHDSRDADAPAGYAALQADYETRRIYTLVAADTLQSPDEVQFNRLRGRLGFAPYLAPIEVLHTWLIAQVEYTPEMEDETNLTPLVRFFYNNYALELGSSIKGDPFVAAMAHF